MKTELATETLLQLIEEWDLEQIRQDNRRLVTENSFLRERVEELENFIVTNARTEFVLH